MEFMKICTSNHVPVLINVFNRPDKVEKLFEVLRKVKPINLYVSCDGPRKSSPSDFVNIEKVKSIIDNVDWDCRVHTKYSEVNLGCTLAIPSAIDWLFSNEEIGIVLEDDCIPSEFFFEFCAEMLEVYKDKKEVMHISGSNLNEKYGVYSYYFSRYGQIWGWATWRDRWNLYDRSVDMELNSNAYFSKKEEKFWSKNFTYNFWDVRWAVFTIWKFNGISIIPNNNLISNIGFGSDATHYKDDRSIHSNMNHEEMNFPLFHPSMIWIDKQHDNFLFLKHYHKTLLQIISSKLYVLVRSILTSVLKRNV